MKWYNWLFLVFMLLVHIPGILLGYLWVLVLLPWACEKPKFEFPAILTAEWRDWVKDKWKYSTTLSRGIVFQPHIRKFKSHRVKRHERVHVRQTEDLTFLSLLVGLVVGIYTGDWWLAGALWFSGPAWQLPFFVTALRFLKPKPANVSWFKHIAVNTMYYESEHERSARGQVNEGRK